MKVIAYALRRDGTASPAGGQTEMDRLTLEGFKKAYGGEAVSIPCGWSTPPSGFSMWRTASGQLFAVNFGEGR